MKHLGKFESDNDLITKGALDGKADKTHNHTISDIDNLQTELNKYATKDDLASVDVSNQLQDYAKKNWVEDNLSETAEGMNKSISNLFSNFNDFTENTIVKIEGKAEKNHTHTIKDIIGLQNELDGKATKDDLTKIDISSQLNDYAKKNLVEESVSLAMNTSNELFNSLNGKLDNMVTQVGVNKHGVVVYVKNNKWYNQIESSSYYRPLALKNHTHEISDVNGLKSVLDNKASSKHYHDIEDINNLQTALNNKANLSHTHSEYLKKGDPIILTSQQKAELKGDRGATGANGTSVSISSTLKNTTKRVTVVTFSNGTVIEIPWGENGKNGAQGWRGDPGKDGSSITTWVGTQSQYNSISSKSSTTLYLIKE